jgi:integrase
MLKDALETYLSIRRSAGFGLEESERMLGLFVTFAADRGDTHVRAATAIEWAKSASTLGVRHQRLQCVALFAQHLRAEDPRHEVPRKDLFHRPPRELRPYIYSPEEARQLVAAAGQLGPAGSLRPHTFAALFALLFSTGLRISEALALRFVDVADGGLYIVGSKFCRRKRERYAE